MVGIADRCLVVADGRHRRRDSSAARAARIACCAPWRRRRRRRRRRQRQREEHPDGMNGRFDGPRGAGHRRRHGHRPRHRRASRARWRQCLRHRPRRRRGPCFAQRMPRAADLALRFREADLTDEAAVRAGVAEALAAFGRLDARGQCRRHLPDRQAAGGPLRRRMGPHHRRQPDRNLPRLPRDVLPLSARAGGGSVVNIIVGPCAGDGARRARLCRVDRRRCSASPGRWRSTMPSTASALNARDRRLRSRRG